MPVSSRDLKHLSHAFKGKPGFQVPASKRRRGRGAWVLGGCVLAVVFWVARGALDATELGLGAFEITTATAASNGAIVTPEVVDAPVRIEERVVGNTGTPVKAIALPPAGALTQAVPSAPAALDADAMHRGDAIGSLPATIPDAVLAAPAEEREWLTIHIERGDSLSAIFDRHGVAVADALTLAKAEDAAVLSSLVPGRSLHILPGVQGRVAALRYELDYASELHAEKIDQGFDVAIVARDLQKRLVETHVEIDSSLYVAGMNSGVPDSILVQLTEIYGWAIDFALDVRRGDTFKVIYEESYYNGERVGIGDIVAADFFNNGRHHRAIRFVHDGRSHYYTPKGNSLKRAFLRTPVKYTRITSKFTNRRYHPILKRWRAHRGVDYGAPRGTPVRATADGKVEYRGKKRGYGNVVILRHGGKYSTVYAHLSKFAKKAKSGSTVKQGQTIAYVGSTGYATGPHLHYEFRVNNKHHDPLTVKLPASLPIPDKYRHAFDDDAAIWSAKLDDISAPSIVAAGDDNQS